MGVTHIAAFTALAGAALVTVGLFLIFGAWALVAAGVVVLVAALVPDWERDG